jgi:hypothetical protein
MFPTFFAYLASDQHFPTGPRCGRSSGSSGGSGSGSGGMPIDDGPASHAAHADTERNYYGARVAMCTAAAAVAGKKVVEL